jgi:hypothetical protein
MAVHPERNEMPDPIPYLRREVASTDRQDDGWRSIAQVLVHACDNRIAVVWFHLRVQRSDGMVHKQKREQGGPGPASGPDSRRRVRHAGTLRVASAWSQATPCDRRRGAANVA